MEKIDVIDKIRKSNELLSLPQVISEILKEMNKSDGNPCQYYSEGPRSDRPDFEIG